MMGRGKRAGQYQAAAVKMNRRGVWLQCNITAARLELVADTWQLAGEIIGRTLGVRTQLRFVLDDLMPTIFGKPLLSGR
jgi:hypothetical protein